MAATYRAGPACVVLAANPSVLRQAVAQKFFPDHQVHPAPALPVAVYADGFRPALALADASAGPDAGLPASVDYQELCQAPVHDSPCALAWADVEEESASADVMVAQVLRAAHSLALQAVAVLLLPEVLPFPDVLAGVAAPAQVRPAVGQAAVLDRVLQAAQRVAASRGEELVRPTQQEERRRLVLPASEGVPPERKAELGHLARWPEAPQVLRLSGPQRAQVVEMEDEQPAHLVRSRWLMLPQALPAQR